MKNTVKIGMNRTGLGMAPHMSPEMLDQQDDAFKAFAQAIDDPMPEQTYEDIKQDYIRESGVIGTLPPPPTVKGVVMSGFQKITLRHPEVLIDKLGERMAFERTGARLYEAFILKCETALPEPSIGFLREIHADELRHFTMLKEVLEELGADPTAVTPCANVAGVASAGLLQVVNDPRTSVPQAALAILTAELVDNDGWGMLIELTDKAGLDQITARFHQAKEAEERHLDTIRLWLSEMNDRNDVVEPTSPVFAH
jgi:rubrerythrin